MVQRILPGTKIRSSLNSKIAWEKPVEIKRVGRVMARETRTLGTSYGCRLDAKNAIWNIIVRELVETWPTKLIDHNASFLKKSAKSDVKRKPSK
jgi:hypothetical protein